MRYGEVNIDKHVGINIYMHMNPLLFLFCNYFIFSQNIGKSFTKPSRSSMGLRDTYPKRNVFSGARRKKKI